jgi:tRNA modification GTPase
MHVDHDRPVRTASPGADLTPASVALLTPPGRAALAVVGVVGEAAARLVDRSFAARRGTPATALEDGAIVVGTWRSDAGSAGEELVVVRRRRDLVEVHCHGGVAASAAVIASLARSGAETVSWQEWLVRSGQSTVEAEARAAVAVAGGSKGAMILARQLAGALDREFERIATWRSHGDVVSASAAGARLLRAARVGLRLVRPWRVVLAGAVNAGKSSLVNALAGHARCLVSPQPGTTRDVVETRLVVEGWELDLVDTAGLRHESACDAVEREGIARALEAHAGADLVLRVVESTDPELSRGAAEPGELLVVTKGDLLPAGTPIPPQAVLCSAVTGDGIASLAIRIAAMLVPEETAEPTLLAGAVPFTDRQLDELRRLLSPADSPDDGGRPGGPARAETSPN